MFRGWENSEKLRDLLRLFSQHLTAIGPLPGSALTLFTDTFLTDPKKVSKNLAGLLQVLE